MPFALTKPPSPAGSCNVTSHNLVLAFWFTFGMVDSESYEWFSKPERRPLTFEAKIRQVMLPWMAEQRIRAPDLVIEARPPPHSSNLNLTRRTQTSLFWDDGFLGQARPSPSSLKQSPNAPPPAES